MEQKKKKVFSLIFVSLIGLNLIVILFIFFVKPTKIHEGPEYDKFIIESLDFNKKQCKLYQKEILLHQKLSRKQQILLNLQKRTLYNELKKQKIDTTKTNEIISNLCKTKKELETIHFEHFIKIKSICKTEQISAFNKIVPEFPYFFEILPRKK